MTGHNHILLIYPTLTHMIYPVHDRRLGLAPKIWGSQAGACDVAISKACTQEILF